MISTNEILGAKILVVDDLEANVILLERMLQGAGYTSISSTTNPRLVCAMHQEHQYDLILLDLQMPVMDGFEVMDQLKEIETVGYIPVLVITAQPGHKLRALQSGARDFLSKPLELAEVLARVHNLLEIRLLHNQVRKLYGRLLEEQQLSENLLKNVLPPSIAERLKTRPETPAGTIAELVADTFDDVTVLFADIVNFEAFSETVSVEELVGVLNDLFTRFDAIADARGMEKIKTHGDGYLAAAGLPVAAADHASRAALMALDMLNAIRSFHDHSPHRLEIRIGIDTGSVVAGVIGKRKFMYDLWGNVVNNAHQMESCALPDHIHITDVTRLRLGDAFTVDDWTSDDAEELPVALSWYLTGAAAS